MGLGPHAARWGGERTRLLRGSLDGTGEPGSPSLEFDWERIEGLPWCNGFESGLADGGASGEAGEGEGGARRAFFAGLAASVQSELEHVMLDFLRKLRRRTGEENLVLVGGVALNSVLNGRIAREAGFSRVWVPPAPDDAGIPSGCAAFAANVMLPRLGLPPAPPRAAPFPAYQGIEHSKQEVLDAIEEFAPWVEAVPLPPARRAHPGLDERQAAVAELAAAAILDGEVLALVDGRSELGARALGHRSILADARRADIHTRVNRIKRREQWRPLAPSVAAEAADEFFEGVPAGGSPYMSFTA